MPKGEYITDDRDFQEQGKLEPIRSRGFDESLGLTTAWPLATTEGIMRRRINKLIWLMGESFVNHYGLYRYRYLEAPERYKSGKYVTLKGHTKNWGWNRLN